MFVIKCRDKWGACYHERPQIYKYAHLPPARAHTQHTTRLKPPPQGAEKKLLVYKSYTKLKGKLHNESN